VVVREKENIIGPLLNYFGIKYESLHPETTGLINKGLVMLKNVFKILKISKNYNPDILVGPLGPYITWIGSFHSKPNINLLDSEPSDLIINLSLPFATSIITPYKFSRNLPKKKHITVHSYKELAYLHPNWFKPNTHILSDLGLNKKEKFVLLRFGSFKASHDIGISGFSLETKMKLIKTLNKYLNIFISSEISLPSKLEKFRLTIPPEKLHDVLYYSTLLICDTQTSTTEAACLGTPAVRCNKWVGPNDMSNFIELEQKYGLIYNIKEPKKAIEKAVELIQKPNLKQEWQKKREKLLKDKIDFTAFLIWFIENFPKSQQIMKKNPKYENKFKLKIKK